MSWDGIGDFLSRPEWDGLGVLVAIVGIVVLIVLTVIGWFLFRSDKKSPSSPHFTIEAYYEELRKRLSESRKANERARKDLERAHKAEQKLSRHKIEKLKDEIEILQKENAAIAAKLLSPEEAYESHVQELARTKKQFEELCAELPESVLPQDEYQEAVDEIAKGNTDLADKLLAQVITKADLVGEKVAAIKASAYYQRGNIAYNNISWSVAYEYFTQAAQLQPQNWQYQLWAGGLAQDIGEYKAAESYLTKALELAEASKGANHLNTATTLNNLAGVYQSQGRYDKAEPLYERALAIKEKALGMEHPSIATTLNNLAALYYFQGYYKKAEPLYKRALAIREKALGNEHPDVAITLNNLAGLYKAQGLYDKSEPLYERDLAISEKALGKEHPHVATTLNNLAVLYVDQDLYAKAEPLLARAVAIRQKTLPSTHPDRVDSERELQAIRNKLGQSQ